MTRSQKLQLARHDRAKELGTLLDIETADRTEDQVTRVADLTREIRSLDDDIAAAILAEPEPVPVVAQEDAEGVEVRSLIGRAKLTPFIDAVLSGGRVEGAEREVRSALMGPSAMENHVPYELLADPTVETRADAATTVPAAAYLENQQPTLSRIFTESVAARLGFQMPSVAPGTATYPVVTGGVSPSFQARGTAKDAEAVTLSVSSVQPTRCSCRVLLRIEDRAMYPQLETTLRNDMRMAMTNKLDDVVLNGTGTAPEIQGILGGAVTVPAASTTDLGYDEAVATIAGEVDGIHSYRMSDLRFCMGSATYAAFAAEIKTGTRESLLRFLTAEGIDYFVSSRIPAEASDAQYVVVAKTRGMGSAVMPFWNGGAELSVTDPYSEAASGQVAISMHALTGLEVVRDTGLEVLSFKIS